MSARDSRSVVSPRMKAFTFAVFAVLMQFISCGYIDVMDYEIDYTNISDVTEIKFTFQLESGLSEDSFLRLTFPVQMYTTSISAVVVKYTFQGETSCSPMMKFPATIILDGSSTLDYLISFQNDISQNVALEAAPYWYTLYFLPESGVTLTAGIQKPILARTQSIDSVASIYGSPIIYDFTNTFAVLEFDSAPTSTLTVSTVVTTQYTSLQYVVGRSYEISFVITPSVAIAYNARIMILVKSDQRFKFIGTCISEENVSGGVTTAALSSSVYTCEVDSDKNRIVVSLTNPVVASSIYRFRTAILNPGHVTVSSAGFEIRTLYGGSNKIVERAILTGLLYTTILSATKTVVMGNGIDLSSSTYYLNAAVIAGNYFYNPFQFQFTSSIQTPDKVELKVIFKLAISMTNDKILTGSIQHNFPRFDVTIPVSCVLENMTTYYQIACYNVGTLSSSKYYYTTARIYFNSAGTLDTYFGSVAVYSIDTDNSSALVSLIPMTTQSFGTSTIVANTNRVDTTSSTYGYQMIHTQTSYTTASVAIPLTAVTSSTAGIKTCSDMTIKQKIVVTFAAGAFSQFGAGPDIGISLITTPLIKAAPGSTGSMFYVESLNSCTSSTEFSTDASRMITTSSSQTLVLMYSTGSSVNNNDSLYLFDKTYYYFHDNQCLQQGTSGTTTFSIGDVYVQGYSSGYAGRDAFDVYGALFSNYATGTTPTTYFGVNSYTISRTGTTCSTTSLQYINVGLSNYQTTTASQTQLADGSNYSAFIRVTGYLTDEEKANVQRIVVFFNNVNFFSTSADSFGQMKASCSSSMTPDQQCWGYSGLVDESSSVFSMKRVEFDVSPFIAQTGSSSPFQLLIPVAAIALKNVQRIFVATMKRNPYYGQLTQAFVLGATYPDYRIVTGSTAAIHTPLSDLSYSIDVTTRTQGAYYKSKQRYGIFCPFTYIAATQTIDTNSKVTFGNFLYPALGPLKLSNTYISWSQNTGDLIAALADPTPATATLTANTITNVANIVLRRYVKDNRVEWLFTTANPFPANGIVTIKLDDTTGTWAFTVMTGGFSRCIMYKQTGTFSETNCAVTTDISNVKIIFTFSASSAFPAGDYKLVQYGIESPTTSVSTAYKITISTATSAGSVIDQSGNTSKLTYLNTATISTSVSIDDYSYSHYLTPNSMGNFVMDFTLDQRPLLALSTPSPGAGLVAGQYLELSINQLSGQETTIQCQVFQNGSIYFGFKSMSVTSASSIKIFPRDDILTEGSQFTFKCLNVKNSYAASQLYKVSILYSGGTLTALTGQLVPTAAQNPTFNSISAISSITLSKYNGLAGALHHLSFSITLASHGVTESTSFFITFPLKYSINAGSATLSCKINSKTAYCINYSERKIQVSASALTIAAGNAILLEVFGVSAPLSSAGSDTIQVSFSTSILPKDVVEQLTITDAATLADTTTTLTVTYATQTNYISRQLSVYQFNGKCTNSIPSGAYILLEFPREFGTSITTLPPTTCVLTNTAGSTTYSSTFTIFGQNIMFTLTTAIPASTEFKILITSLLTPEDTECKITKLILSALSSNRLTVLARSSTASSNQPLIRSKFDSTLHYINWFDTSSTQIKYNKQYIEINAGTYSKTITLMDSTGALSGYITYTLSSVTDATFSVISDMTMYPGTKNETMRIGCPITTIPGFFTLVFVKNEAGVNIYGGFSLINVKVNQATHSVAPQFQQYNVFAGGYSVPIIFDLTEMIPYEEVQIQLTTSILGTDPQIDLVNDSNTVVPQITLTFSPTSYKAKIKVLSRVFMTATSAHNSVLNMVVFGTDSSSYAATTTNVVLQLISISPIPSLSYTQTIDQVSPKATQQLITINANLPVTVYYHIRISGGPDRVLAEVQYLIDSYVVLNPMDYYQEQFGLLNYQTNLDTDEQFWISSLRSKLDYTITTWTYDALHRTGTATDFTFSTKNNNGRLMRIPITFASAITSTQKKSITCYMCQKFAIPCLNVYSFDNKYCDTLSEYTISIVDTINNIERRRFLVDDDIDDDHMSQEAKIQYHQSNYSNFEETPRSLATTTTSVTVNFYTISIDEYESDLSWNLIIKNVTKSTFASLIAAYDTTLPTISEIGTPTEIVKSSAPSFTDMVSVTKGTTWIAFDTIETNARSLVWFYLVDYSDGGTPTDQQMKFMLDSWNNTVSNFQIQLYDTSASVAYNFTGLLSETQYALYYMATTENPSLFALVSDIAYVGAMTDSDYSTAVTSSVKIAVDALIIAVLLIVVIH